MTVDQPRPGTIPEKAQLLNRVGTAAVPPPAMSVPPPPPIPRAAFEGIQSATILKPGDRVLIDCGMKARRSDIEALHSYLKECVPDVVFVVLGGVRVVAAPVAEDVVVKPAEETT